MPCDGSITVCLQRLKVGDRDAAQLLWERYFRRLVGLALREATGQSGRPRGGGGRGVERLRQRLSPRRARAV